MEDRLKFSIYPAAIVPTNKNATVRFLEYSVVDANAATKATIITEATVI